MNSSLQQLIELLKLSASANPLVYVGKPQNLGLRQLYGGLLYSQALSALLQYSKKQFLDKQNKIGKDSLLPKQLHSCNAYFLRAGNVKDPIYYHIQPLRFGRTFMVLEVIAEQSGEQLLSLQASFQQSEDGFMHQTSLKPDLPEQNQLLSEHQLAKKLASFIPDPIKAYWLSEPAIEILPVEPLNPFFCKTSQAAHQMWIKSNGTLENQPDFIHTVLLAYISDHNFLPTALKPHAKGFLEKDMQVATLSHAIWFHRPFKLDEWLAYIIKSPTAQNARALVCGEIFNKAGELVATTMQEGLIRQYS